MQKFKRLLLLLIGFCIFVVWLYWRYLRTRYIGEIDFNFTPLRILFLSINVLIGGLFITATMLNVEPNTPQDVTVTKWMTIAKTFLYKLKDFFLVTYVQKLIKDSLYELFLFTNNIWADKYVLNQPYFKLTEHWVSQYSYYRKVRLFYIRIPQIIVAISFVIDTCLLKNFYFFPRLVYLLIIPYIIRIIVYICTNYCELKIKYMHEYLDIIPTDIGELEPILKKDLDKEDYETISENFAEIRAAYGLFTFYVTVLKRMGLEELFFEDIFFLSGLRVFYFWGSCTMLLNFFEIR